MGPLVAIASVRRRLRATVAGDGAARLLVLLVAGAGAAVLVDRLWLLPGWLRLLLLAGLLVALAVVLWRRLLRPLRRALPDREVAVFIERRTPALAGRLLTAVEGIPLGDDEAARLAAALPPARALVPASRLPRLATAAVLALLLALAVGLVAPSFWRDGLVRLALPLSDHDWERATALAVRPERAVVAADQPAVLLIERTRGRPGAVRLAWSGGPGEGGARQLPGATGPWRQAVPLPPGRWTVTVRGGDAHPASTTVLVVNRPTLDGAATRLTPPAYAGLPAQDLPSPACQALSGSRLELRFTPGAPPGREVTALRATLGGAAVPLRREGATWLGEALIAANGELVVEAEDADGIAMLPPARFAVLAEPDRAPAVSLGGPRGDETVGPRAKVAVGIDASDDLGLARLDLAATVSGAPGAPAARDLLAEALDGRRAISRRVLVDVAALAGPGGSITLVGRAADRNDITGPGIGSSAPLVLRVVAEDELRRDLERLLTEARDRVVQARAALAPALADPGKLAAAARASGQDAGRAAELIERVERRWRENALEAERIAPATEARSAVAEAAVPALARAAGGEAAAGAAGDKALETAERALDRMLADSDLTRIVTRLLEQQKALAEETRAFVREHLTKAPDEAGLARQAELARRQTELAARTADTERRVLSGPDALARAKTVVQEQAPADRMGQAAAGLAEAAGRARAIERQQAAIAALNSLLDALRGGDQLADLARRAGELAERQERLAEAIERGLPADQAQREQERLRQETERLAEDVKANADAQAAAKAAAGAQQAAGSALGANNRAAAARDAGTAGELLRAAQRALDPRQQEERDKQKEKANPDVLALLRALFQQQAKVLADSLPIDQRIGEDDPDFAARRDLAAVAQQQDDILLRLREEGMKLLDRQPIALAALKRVETAMDRVLTHVRRPALGARGLALERIALAELKRVIDIAGDLPQSPGGGDGQGGQGGEQPPFPPAAEIALLIARQDEIHAMTAAGRPVDLGAMQDELTKLVALVEGATRPGTRPNLLMARARGAAQAAATLLAARDAGALPRHHMLAAGENLRQLLAEAKGSGGGGGGGGGGRPPPSPGGGDGAPPPPGGGAPPAGSPGMAGGQPQPAGTLQPGQLVQIDQERTALLQLPPERREQLRQAREQRLPAGALQLFERYLEKLEER